MTPKMGTLIGLAALIVGYALVTTCATPASGNTYRPEPATEGATSSSEIRESKAAASAPSLSITVCTNGASGSAFGGGGAVALTDPFCKLVIAAYVASDICSRLPTVPVPCGGGGELPPIDTGASGLVTVPSPDSDMVIGTIFKFDPAPLECHIVNPACEDAQGLWGDVYDATRADVGYKGWRWKVKQFLPAIISWIF